MPAAKAVAVNMSATAAISASTEVFLMLFIKNPFLYVVSATFASGPLLNR
jgi:hypothetical protein